jgi:hypothetical protein
MKNLKLLINNLFGGSSQPSRPHQRHPHDVVLILLGNIEFHSHESLSALEPHIVQEINVIPDEVLLVLVVVETVGNIVESCSRQTADETVVLHILLQLVLEISQRFRLGARLQAKESMITPNTIFRIIMLIRMKNIRS